MNLDVKKYFSSLQNISLPFWIMFINTFVMALGFFMLVPLLATHLLENMAFSAAMIGTISAARSFSQQGFMVWCGNFADKIGYKAAICMGVLIRTAGFGLLSAVESFHGFIIAGVLAGLGGSLFHPASYATYAILTDEKNRVMIYSIREILSNVGFILGPVVGAFLLRWNFKYVCWVSGVLFLSTFFLALFFLPSFKPENKPLSFIRSTQLVIKNKLFIRFILILLGSWLINSQLYLAVPIRVEEVMPGSNQVGYVYSLSAIIMVIVQMPLLRFIDSLLKPLDALAVGTLLLAAGLGMLGFGTTIYSVYVGAIIFTIGQVIIQPMKNNMVTQYAGNENIASYFGMQGLALAVGGFLGNVCGGCLYDIGRIGGFEFVPWLVFIVIGLFTSFAFMKESNYQWGLCNEGTTHLD